MSYYSSVINAGVTDSCNVVNGKFQFLGNINGPVIAFIRMDNSRVIDRNTLTVFLEPSELATELNCKPFEIISFVGSKTQLEYISLNQLQSKNKLLFKPILDKLYVEENKNIRDSIRTLLKPFFEAQTRDDLNFINSNPSSFVTGYLLQSYYKMPLDTLRRFYNNMPENLQSSIYGKQLATTISQKSASLKGKMAVNFISKDVNGKLVKLSDFRGKYVLLDFWASWCIPCRNSNPHLVKVFNRYRSKGFTIIGVSSDEKTKIQWKRAIVKDKLVWPQILRGSTSGTDTTNINYRFNVNSIPTKMLIDKSGYIIGRWDGQTETNDRQMDSL